MRGGQLSAVEALNGRLGAVVDDDFRERGEGGTGRRLCCCFLGDGCSWLLLSGWHDFARCPPFQGHVVEGGGGGCRDAAGRACRGGKDGVLAWGGHAGKAAHASLVWACHGRGGGDCLPGEEEVPQDMAWGVHVHAAGGAARCRVYVGLRTKKGLAWRSVPWAGGRKGAPVKVVGGGDGQRAK